MWVEDASPQPKGGAKGGGVAALLPAVSAGVRRTAMLKDGTIQDTKAGRVTARLEFTLDDKRPMASFLLAITNPAAVIIFPLELLYGLSPAGPPRVNLFKSSSDPQANKSCSHAR